VTDEPAAAGAIDPDAFCREIEAHLCRRNGGHLIRLVGPSFELAMGWARQGIPLRVAQAGIDRCIERHQRKGPSRRPVRVEFCEADVLDAFDHWRRSLGIATVVADSGSGPDVEEPVPAPGRARRSLATHIEGLQARLTVLRGGERSGPAMDKALDDAVRALDALRAEAAGARGDARERLLTALVAVDAALVSAATAALAPDTKTALESEAAAELAPFRPRMTADGYAESRRAALDRLVRLHVGLPEF